MSIFMIIVWDFALPLPKLKSDYGHKNVPLLLWFLTVIATRSTTYRQCIYQWETLGTVQIYKVKDFER